MCENDAVTAYLGFGANIGDPVQSINKAILKLEDVTSVKIRQVSSFYRTAPIGLTDQPDFINAVARVETRLTPEELLSATLNIENQMGRVRTNRWGPRVIDIDVLLYGGIALSSPALTIPHPRMFDRAFVLVPLLEVAPDIDILGRKDGEPIAAVAARLSSDTRVVKMS